MLIRSRKTPPPAWSLEDRRSVITLTEDLLAAQGRVRELEKLVVDLAAENERLRSAR